MFKSQEGSTSCFGEEIYIKKPFLQMYGNGTSHYEEGSSLSNMNNELRGLFWYWNKKTNFTVKGIVSRNTVTQKSFQKASLHWVYFILPVVCRQLVRELCH